MTLQDTAARSSGQPKFMNQQSLSTRSQQEGIGFIPVTILVVMVLLLLKAPGDWRDALFVAGAVVCFAVALHDFAAVWIALLAVLPFVGLVGSVFGQVKVDGVRILLVGMTFLLLARKKGPDFWHSLLKQLGLLGFLLFVLANIASSIIGARSIESLFRSIAYFGPLLFYVLTYYIVRENPANLQRVLRGVMLGGILVGILGLVEFVEQRPIMGLLGINITIEDPSVYLAIDRFGLGGRIVSIIGQPVYTGMYYSIWLIISIYYILVYTPKYRNLLAILIPMGTLLIIATGSRAPLVAFVPTLLAFAAFNPRKRRALVITGIGVALFIASVYIWIPSLPGYFQASFATDVYTEENVNVNVLGRIELTKTMLDIAWRNPVFGYGPGMIQKTGYVGSGYVGLGGLENQYATILAEGGLLVGFFYLLFMWGTLRSLLRIRQSRRREVGHGGLMTLLIFVFYFAFAISATCLILVPNLLIMAIYGAVVAIYDNAKGAGCDPSPVNQIGE